MIPSIGGQIPYTQNTVRLNVFDTRKGKMIGSADAITCADGFARVIMYNRHSQHLKGMQFRMDSGVERWSESYFATTDIGV